MNCFTQNLTVRESKNHICLGVKKQIAIYLDKLLDMTDPVLTWSLRVLSVTRANRFFVIICFIQHAALMSLSKQIHWIKVI